MAGSSGRWLATLIDGDPPQTIGVLIPTYRRPAAAVRCLDGIIVQSRRADDIMFVVRRGDAESVATLTSRMDGRLPVRILTVERPGLVAARNAGLDACRTDVLAMIDDDAVPHPDWLDRILAHFQRNPRLGGLGGKDHCYDGTKFDDGRAIVVGKLQWFGRVIGNHHRGFGEPREVDILKGVNMSYRAKVFTQVRFDERLRGSGAQANEDLCFSVAVRNAGWKLLYDPAVLVVHHIQPREEPRFYGGVIPVWNATGFRDFAFNEVMAIWDVLPPGRRGIFAIWSALVGTGVCPGLLQALRYSPRLGLMSWRRFVLAQAGKLAAFKELGWRRLETAAARDQAAPGGRASVAEAGDGARCPLHRVREISYLTAAGVRGSEARLGKAAQRAGVGERAPAPHNL
jgi:GT2 family glycosyltransferase